VNFQATSSAVELLDIRDEIGKSHKG